MMRFPRAGALPAILAQASLILALCLEPAARLRAEPGDMPVPPALRRQVTQYFYRQWVLPELVRYQWLGVRPAPAGDIVVCGRVNYQDSTRVYIGWRAFFAVIHGSEIPTARIQPESGRDDPVRSITNTFNLLCGRHETQPG